jgi:hypothetical protein
MRPGVNESAVHLIASDFNPLRPLARRSRLSPAPAVALESLDLAQRAACQLTQQTALRGNGYRDGGHSDRDGDDSELPVAALALSRLQSRLPWVGLFACGVRLYYDIPTSG